MALPAHLAKYSGVLDIFVEAMVGEILQDAQMKTPIGTRPPTGAKTVTNTSPETPTQEDHGRCETYRKNSL
jgi:hypothetical protein